MTSIANFVIRPGDIYTCRVDYKTEAGAAINITGETATLTVSADGLTNIVLTSGSGLTVTAATGQIDVALTSAQTTTLDGKKNRRFKLRLTPSEKTILAGDIEEEPR